MHIRARSVTPGMSPDDDPMPYTPDRPTTQCWFAYILHPLMLVGHCTCLLYDHPNTYIRCVKMILFAIAVAIVGGFWSKIVYDIVGTCRNREFMSGCRDIRLLYRSAIRTLCKCIPQFQIPFCNIQSTNIRSQ
jgi:hypothetical protein